jgi:hypothetical protein
VSTSGKRSRHAKHIATHERKRNQKALAKHTVKRPGRSRKGDVSVV